MHPSRPLGRAHATSPSSRRLLRQLAGQVGFSQIAHRRRSALEKAHNRCSDNRTKVVGRLHAIHPTANGQVEELPMQAPGYFQLIRRQSAIGLVRHASDMPQFEAQRLYDPIEPAFPRWYRILRYNSPEYSIRYNILCEIERGSDGGPGGTGAR